MLHQESLTHFLKIKKYAGYPLRECPAIFYWGKRIVSWKGKKLCRAEANPVSASFFAAIPACRDGVSYPVPSLRKALFHIVHRRAASPLLPAALMRTGLSDALEDGVAPLHGSGAVGLQEDARLQIVGRAAAFSTSPDRSPAPRGRSTRTGEGPPCFLPYGIAHCSAATAGNMTATLPQGRDRSGAPPARA